jgi:hypothetical protein
MITRTSDAVEASAKVLDFEYAQGFLSLTQESVHIQPATKNDRLWNLQDSVTVEVRMVVLFCGESPGIPELSVCPKSLAA